MSFMERRNAFLERKASMLARMEAPRPRFAVDEAFLQNRNLSKHFKRPILAKAPEVKDFEEILGAKTDAIMDDLVQDAEAHMNFMESVDGKPAYGVHKVMMGQECAPEIGISAEDDHCRLSIAYLEKQAFLRNKGNPLEDIYEDVKGKHRHANVSNYEYCKEMKAKYPDYVKEVVLVEDVDAAVLEHRKNKPRDRRSEEEIRLDYMSVKDLKPGDELHVPGRSQSGKHAIMYKGQDEEGNYMAISHNKEKLWNVLEDTKPGRVVVYQKSDIVKDKLKENFSEIQKEHGTAAAFAYLEEKPKTERSNNNLATNQTNINSAIINRLIMAERF